MANQRLFLSLTVFAALGIVVAAIMFLFSDPGEGRSGSHRSGRSEDSQTDSGDSSDSFAPFTSSNQDGARTSIEAETSTPPPQVSDQNQKERMGWVAGRVENSWGAGIPQALITLRPGWSYGLDAGSNYTATTDEEGEFRVKVPLVFSGTLSASADGYRDAYEFGVLAGMDLVCVLEEGVNLRGRVTDIDSGLPISQALISYTSGLSQVLSRSDEGGQFILGPLEPGTATIYVGALGYERERVDDIAVGDESAPPIDIELRSGEPLSVRVVALANDRPLEDAEVTYELRSGGRRWSRNRDQGESLKIVKQTDAQGRVYFDRIGIDGAMLAIRHPDFLPLDHRLESVPTLGEDLLLSLKSSWRAEGQVVDPKNRPIKGATVMTRAAVRGRGERATSDEEGRFSLGGLNPEVKTELVADHPSYAPVQSEGVSPGSENIIIKLGVPGRIYGQVQNDKGEPVADARIELTANGRVTRLTRNWPKTCFSDDTGRFEFPGLPEGRFALSAITEAYVGSPESVQLEDGKEEEVVLKLTPGQSIQGQVIDDRGGTIEGARVSAREVREDTRRRDGNDSSSRMGRSRSRSTRTDSTGRFAMSGFGEGTSVRLTVSRRGHTTARETVSAGAQGVIITLKSEGSLQGTAVDKTTGRPLTAFSVEVRASSQGSSNRSFQFSRGRANIRNENFVGTSGHFVVDRLSPGTYRVRVHADAYESSPFQEVLVESGVASPMIRLEAEPGCLITGSVRGPGGKLVSGAPVYLRKKGGSGSRTRPRWVYSSDDGGYQIENIQPGEYWLGLGDPELPLLDERSLEIEKGQVLDEDFRVPGLGTMEVTVRDEKGELIEGIRVRARMQAGPRLQKLSRSDARGSAIFREVLPGNYVVYASSRGRRSQDFSAQVTASSRLRIDLQLRAQ